MRDASNLLFGRTFGPSAFSGKFEGLAEILGPLLTLGLLLVPGSTRSAAAAPTYSVTIAWDPNPETTVIGYRAHHGIASRDYPNVVDAGNTTSVIIPGLVEGMTYYFSVTAYNVFGLESDFSEELSYVPGTPTVRVRVLPGGQAVLTLRGQINQAYAIEATADFNNWTVMATVTLGANGSYQFTDPQWALFTRRFYRLRDLQP